MSQVEQSFSYRFGEWLVEPSLNRISRNGEEVSLEPKSIEVLRCLLERPGVVVSADELIDSVWPGRVIEPNTLHRHVMRLRQALADDAHCPRYIETIPKRGYRTLAAVSREMPRAHLGVADFESAKTSRAAWDHKAIVAVLALTIAGALWVGREPDKSDEAVQQRVEVMPNSLAVLPFDNLSPDPDHAFFAAGIHEEILNQLGQVHGLSVIARTTMLRYAESEKPIPQIAGELNVQAIMAGSVRYSEDQVRVTVQVMDAASGAQLWSDAYQERLEDVFDIQMAIARRIASTLEVQVASDDPFLGSKPPTTNAVAYAHYLRANFMITALDPIGPVFAELDRAIDADPEFASAYATKGFYQTLTYPWPDRHVTRENLRAWAKQGRRNARRALDIDPNQARALLTLGIQASGNLRFDEGNVLIERAYELAPNDIPIINFMSMVRLAQGRGPDVIALEKKKMALDPLNFFHPYGFSGHAWWLEDYVTAADAAQKAISMMPNTFHGYLAAAQAAAGLRDAPTAVRNLERAVELGVRTSERDYVTATAASVYHQLDMPEKAREMLDELELLAANQYVTPRIRLLAYVGSSDVNMIVYWLSIAMKEGLCSTPCWNILHLSKHHAFDGIRDHPEFRALVEAA